MIENLIILKQYQNYDYPDYKGIRDIENLFGKVNEDYYKSVKTKGAFNDNYIEYQSTGTKTNNYQLKNIFS